MCQFCAIACRYAERKQRSLQSPTASLNQTSQFAATILKQSDQKPTPFSPQPQ
jgi:hypothetical protein